MAERLLKAGEELYIYDVDPQAVGALSKLGAKPAKSARDLAHICSIILLCLPNSKIVESVITGPEGILEGAQLGSVVIDMTTANPLSTRSLCEQLEAKGLEMLDAPVSGGPTGAQGGTLAVMVGGKKEVFERCRPSLAIIAPKNLTYVGPISWGHTIKAINNFMNAVQRWITSEGVALAVKAGVPVEKAVEILRLGAARNYSLDTTFPNYILPGKKQGFTAGLMRKDVGIGTEMALELGVPMPMGNHIRELFEFFMWLDGQDQEVNHYIRYLEQWAGIQLRTSIS
jgi:3-hydroxyisobutyrate dehydrogenase